MRQQVLVPKLGELTESVVISSWLCAAGDVVAVGQTLVEVETDKVETEIPSPFAGTVTRLLVAEQDEVAVGQPICEIEP
jgi:pyruvate dehydrogenase E2 component (dihydrolipoamide acetyltransferase)